MTYDPDTDPQEVRDLCDELYPRDRRTWLRALFDLLRRAVT